MSVQVVLLENIIILIGPLFGITFSETESLFTRLARHDKKSAMIDSRNTIATFGEGADETRVCTTEEECIAAFKEMAGSHDFIWLRLRTLENYASETNSVLDKSEYDALTLSRLNGYIQTIYDHIPSDANTAFILFSGQGDTRPASSLLRHRAEYLELCQKHGVNHVHERMKEKVFGQEKMSQLENAIDYAKYGLSFVTLKSRTACDLIEFF